MQYIKKILHFIEIIIEGKIVILSM